MRTSTLNHFLPATIVLLAGTQPAQTESTTLTADEALAASSGTPSLAPFRAELLDMAFHAASAMPIEGHGKSRSRAQEAVVTACLELDEPQLARQYADAIHDWRRGAAYAECAFYLADHGESEGLDRYLELAEEIADTDRGARAQEWRRDRVRVKIARTLARLGRAEEAARFEEGVVDSERGKVDALYVLGASSESFEEQLAALDEILTTASFDRVRNALEACAELHGRFYDDPERRELLERRVRTAYSKLPLMIRIELMEQMIRSALAHDDLAGARELAEATQVMVDSAMWTPEHRVPLLARLAELRFRAGQEAQGKATADVALALFNAEREQIVSIFRCESLLPLAEAYQVMGATDEALAVYAMAVREGADNPNGRPRAEDLAAACRSMALHGVEPGDQLRKQLEKIGAGLAAPW